MCGRLNRKNYTFKEHLNLHDHIPTVRSEGGKQEYSLSFLQSSGQMWCHGHRPSQGAKKLEPEKS
jgi:hypothetical protein